MISQVLWYISRYGGGENKQERDQGCDKGSNARENDNGFGEFVAGSAGSNHEIVAHDCRLRSNSGWTTKGAGSEVIANCVFNPALISRSSSKPQTRPFYLGRSLRYPGACECFLIAE